MQKTFQDQLVLPMYLELRGVVNNIPCSKLIATNILQVNQLIKLYIVILPVCGDLNIVVFTSVTVYLRTRVHLELLVLKRYDIRDLTYF